MMGNRGATNGWEFEAFSRHYRHLLKWGRGELKKIKRSSSRRSRRGAKVAVRAEVENSEG